MASLDVESLFTNIPSEETIENCVNDLFFDKSKIDNLTKRDAYDLSSAATKDSFFIFDNSIYRQIDRVAMESPLGLTLSNAFLCHYEKEWLDSCPIEFKPKLYKKYVDNIFVMFRSMDHVKKFVDYMNTKHPNIRFTFEIEDQNSFSFLDIKIIRNTEKKAFETSVYIKSTFSGAFINFNSSIPMTYKTGLLETMLFRCFSICSSYEKFHQEILKLKEIFKRNSYPEKFIDRCIKNFINKLDVPKVVEDTAAKKELILVLPYLGQQSFEIRNRTQCCLKKNAPT